MLSVSNYTFDASKFDFKFTTSSGDKIEISMFDSIEIDKNFSKKTNNVSSEMTLKHVYEYHFHYEGNGLNKKDIKEIKEAMKKIKPMLEKFLKEKNIHEKEITNFAHNIKILLPNPKDDNHKMAIKSYTLDTFDKVLKDIKITFKELENTKKLFDKIFSNKFEIVV